MTIIRYVLIAWIVMLAHPSQAQDVYPTIFPALRNENPSELDALTGRCNSTDGGETIDCLFITIILNRETDGGETTCKLWGTAGNETLSRVAPGKWSTSTEPSGLCGVVDTVELTCNPEALLECNYFEQSRYTVTTGEACEHYATVEDEGDRYSWQATEKLDLQCDSIEFSYD